MAKTCFLERKEKGSKDAFFKGIKKVGNQLNKTPQTGNAASEAPPGAERPSVHSFRPLRVLSVRLFSQCVDVVGIISLFLSFSLFLIRKNVRFSSFNMDKSVGNH